MIQYIPVLPRYHKKILGADFSEKFAHEMQAFYAPFANKGRPIQLAKETWEYAVADAIPGGKWMGSGKSVVDVNAPVCDLDVKGISCNNATGTTTEASILQNHQFENDNFMSLFKSGDYTGLKKIYVDGLVEKMNKAIDPHVLCCIRNKKEKSVNYALFKVVKSNLNEDQFIQSMQAVNARSVSTPIIDSNYGKIYLYIPKRRMELRLHLKGLQDYLVYSHSYSTNIK